ncbi:cytochrome P450 [Streptomyces sp. CC228A]|uniref:cytochrome P450 n=1 Tax=Streptomyces sp. CC228A TaxID=2898186 RepID=UPI001F393F7C|nr:cytochrome P450 [Streptomyces sp. CC228A]
MTTPTQPRRAAGRLRDRRVHTRSHPVLFALLAAARRTPVTRIGGTVLVHGTDAFREVLTRVPLDRTARGTTGGAARELSSGGLLFDQEGAGHRDARRGVAADLGAAGVERLRPVWREVLERRLAPLEAGVGVDLVPLAREVAAPPSSRSWAAAATPWNSPRPPGRPRPRPYGTICPARACPARPGRPPKPPHGWSGCSTRQAPTATRPGTGTSRTARPAPAPRTPWTAGRHRTGRRPAGSSGDCGPCWPSRP